MACGQTNWVIYEGELDRADVQALLGHHFAEMRADSPPEACHVLPIEGLRGPEIRFVSLRDADGVLLGVGALKALEPGHGEIKSMRTHPEALGRRVGRAMLERLIDIARSQGMRRLSLETGNSALFSAANCLYETSGFVRCGPFGGYPDTPFTHFFTREI
jgi:putative acetyltransferase